MASSKMELQYKDLLCPIKDPAQSFGVNIAELLQDYLLNLVQGKVPPNFNSAALLLQGSSSIYGKKVEYLHNLASQLHQNLIKQKNDDKGKKDKVKEKEEKRKAPKTNEFQILSLVIKPGKNLSCLSRKNLAKNASGKKLSKKIRNVSMPVHLMAFEDNEKVDVLYDVIGEIVGYKGDYALNKCKLLISGWLLIPTVNSGLITTASNYDDSVFGNNSVEEATSNNLPEDECSTHDLLNEPPNSTPSDEGLGTEPRNSEVGSQLVCSPMETNPSEDHPASSDLGIDVDSPMDVDNANPQSSAEVSTAKDAKSSLPNRKSTRKVLTELDPAENEKSMLLKPPGRYLEFKREIRKGKTYTLPRKLRKGYTEEKLEDISSFCARTFFIPELKLTRKEKILWGSVACFERNSRLFNLLAERLKFMRDLSRKRSRCQPDEDDEVIVDDDDDMESGRARDDGKENDCKLLEDSDFPTNPSNEGVEFEGAESDGQPISPYLDGEDNPSESFLVQVPGHADGFRAITDKYIKDCTKEVNQLHLPCGASKDVHQWEATIKPVLKGIEKRENFDIDLYGSRILNTFQDSNRKQSMTFREFCKGKPKWEIHRYFMSLLPLVNIGNVSIDIESSEDGIDEEISITLLSRKMHHKELEEFGHSNGEHP